MRQETDDMKMREDDASQLFIRQTRVLWTVCFVWRVMLCIVVQFICVVVMLYYIIHVLETTMVTNVENVFQQRTSLSSLNVCLECRLKGCDEFWSRGRGKAHK